MKVAPVQSEHPALIGSGTAPELAGNSQKVAVAEAGPRHIAIIMDGNHRWARGRGLPSSAGHRAGAGNVRPVAEACVDAGVGVLTLFAFSTENWRRPKREVRLLMGLIKSFLERDIDELHERGVRLRIIGDREPFDDGLKDLMNYGERLTEGNSALT
ncbi:MAG: polyprenyl diphosphate synthase, partial [Pseudomonadales bacterium]